MKIIKTLLFTVITSLLFLASGANLSAQTFDFTRVEQAARGFLVVVDLKIDISLGTQNDEQELRLLGTIVTEDGLMIFDGAFLAEENILSSASGMTVKTSPKKITATMLDGKKYDAEYIGTDRFTKISFARLNAPGVKFSPVRFVSNNKFRVGEWVSLYMLLPEFVTPPIAGDVGMVASILETPEKMPLTIGFGQSQMTSVLFNDRYQPVGVLGSLMDPSSASSDPSGMLSSFGESDVPLLGIITGDRLMKMIASPPQRGRIDRAWLGITLQALTPDLREILKLPIEHGIIVNDVVEQSPASKSGLAVGDVIYAIDGATVPVDREEKLPLFQRKIAEMPPGTTVKFSVLRPHDDRDADSMKVSVVLEKAPIGATDAQEYENKDLELTVRNLVFADYTYFRVSREQLQGVVVSELKQGGLAQIGGLEIGDVIQRVGSAPVSTVDELKTVLEQAITERQPTIVFFVFRDGRTQFVNIKTDLKPTE